jgi:hypothetical protein
MMERMVLSCIMPGVKWGCYVVLYNTQNFINYIKSVVVSVVHESETFEERCWTGR